MSFTKEELDSLHQFAVEKVDNGKNELTMEQLVKEWQAASERQATNDAIREGLADVEAGRCRPLDEFMDEFRAKNNIG